MPSVSIWSVLCITMAFMVFKKSSCIGYPNQDDSRFNEIEELVEVMRNRRPAAFYSPLDKRIYDKKNWFQKKVLIKSRSRNRPASSLLPSPLQSKGQKTLELGVFMDTEAYWILRPIYDDDQIVEILLGLVDQIQAIFYQDSLEEKLILTVAHLEIFKKMPHELRFENAESYTILSSFCNFTTKMNVGTGGRRNRWDMALLFTGHDLYTDIGERRSSATMGLSVIDGICKPQLSCVIGEFGPRNRMGKPFLTSGWMAAYIMAHEMGHNLGMLHDGYGNDCPKNGFLMSASRGTHDETTWSKCSAQIMKRLNESCLMDASTVHRPEWNHSQTRMIPGQFFDADSQCRLYLKEDAAVQDTVDLKSVCSSLRCKSPKRVGHYFVGPALDGTFCDHEKWCETGHCVPRKTESKIRKGNWSKWIIQPCISGCLDHSMGVIRSSRLCNNPKPLNSYFCTGSHLKIELCDHSKICPMPKSRLEYATSKCKTFSKYLPQLTSVGTQMPYNAKKIWQSCALFCRSIFGLWTTPRYELNDLTIDTHFLDGTHCHFDGTRNYFCIQRNCVPETDLQYV